MSRPLIEGKSTLPEVLEEAARSFGEAEALGTGSASLSYAAWWHDAGGLAAELSRRGVSSGDVVVVILPSSIEYAICYAAAARLGAVTSGINPRMGAREVGAILDLLEPKVVVTDSDSRPLVPDGWASAVLDAAELSRHYEEQPPPVAEPDPSDPVAIVWTSGTTGKLKGAWFDHASLKAVAESTGDLAAPFDRRLLPLPFAHAGFMTKIWETTAYVNTIILVPGRWSAEDMLHTLKSQRITVASAVPTQWERLLSLVDDKAEALPDLRVGSFSTAPASPDLIGAVRERLGISVIVRYASTETAMGTGTRIGDPDDVIARTVGRVHPGVELRIVDESDAEVPVGEVGAVHLRSKAQMKGYWKNPGLTAETITEDGWIRVGDLGYLRPDGNLVLAGRRSDMYIRGGYNIYPVEVESVLALHPKVAEVAVIGVPAPDIGEKGVAIVVPADPSDVPELGELRDFVKQHIADYKRPDELVIVDALPHTPLMKVARGELPDLVRAIQSSSGEGERRRAGARGPA